MNREQFVEHLKSEFDCVIELQKVKGRDYSGDEDVFRNFTTGGEVLGTTPLQQWGVLFKKHIDAIYSYIRSDGANQSEPIIGRIRDANVYLFLLSGMIPELQKEKEVKLGSNLPNLSKAYRTDWSGRWIFSNHDELTNLNEFLCTECSHRISVQANLAVPVYCPNEKCINCAPS